MSPYRTHGCVVVFQSQIRGYRETILCPLMIVRCYFVPCFNSMLLPLLPPPPLPPPPPLLLPLPPPALPPGPVPPAPTTFSQPTSPASTPFPRRGPELVTLQCTTQLYYSSSLNIPTPPASPSPNVGTTNFHPETSGAYYQWYVWIPYVETPPGPGP